ncbi:MAG: pilus assembly protein TadG-related protein [Bryobacteraceae bacterium]
MLTKFTIDADYQIVAVSRSRTIERQRGFVLIVTSIALTMLLGLAGLAIDIGRMYVIRAELQSFTDAAALSAALDLDGTDAALAHARTAAQSLAQGPHAMRWDMGTQPIGNIVTTVSADQSGKQSVRVVATEPAPIIFLRIFQPLTSTTVAASSLATKDGPSVRLIQ